MTANEPSDHLAPTQPHPSMRKGDQRLRILISGGGTGGHIYPALAVARVLQLSYPVSLLYIGDADGLETRLVPQAGIRLETIHAGKLLRYWSRETLQGVARVPQGFLEARQIVRAFSPHAAFTSGGYVAVPAGIAARRLGAPLIIHQQDVPPNLANKLLRPFATAISVSFPDSLAYFPKQKTHLMGNPVRDAITAVAGTDSREHKRTLGFQSAFPLLVVTGGSQGARHINQAVTDALPRLLERFQVLHISGQKTFDETSNAAKMHLASLPSHVQQRYRLVAYLDAEMPIALAAADAVIARAGAATLAELATLGKPGILIPLPPGFSGSPQEANAAMFAAQQAAITILDKDLTALTLLGAVDDLFTNADTRIAMSRATRAFARPEAATELANMVVEYAQAFVEEQKRRTVMSAINRASY